MTVRFLFTQSLSAKVYWIFPATLGNSMTVTTLVCVINDSIQYYMLSIACQALDSACNYQMQVLICLVTSRALRARKGRKLIKWLKCDTVIFKMADRPLFIRLSMPSGLEDALEGLAREVLRSQPKDMLEFSAQYFEGLLRTRNKGNYSICIPWIFLSSVPKLSKIFAQLNNRFRFMIFPRLV